MIALLSPAKSLSVKASATLAPTVPHFESEARTLAEAAARLAPADLQRLMRISPALAALNADRYARFGEAETRPALAAFAGDVYRGLDAATLNDDALAFAADRVRILSGLYGLLRPGDAIRDYRLEMGTAWAPGGGDLYGHWRDRVARRVEAELAEIGADTVLNLASKEYWRVVEPHLSPGTRVVSVDFRDAGPAGPRFNTFVAKRARGAMARMMCELGATAPEQLHGFGYAGYAYAGTAQSKFGNVMSFVRWPARRR